MKTLTVQPFGLHSTLLMLALLTAPTVADDLTVTIQPAQHCCDAPACGCCDGCCDGCRDCCVASVEKVKVEKHCWCIEKKKVCVPKVVCPWSPGGSGLTCFDWLCKGKSSCCGDGCCGDACGCGDECCGAGCCGGKGCCKGCCLKPRCGKVKCVRDIRKETYECEECVCKWEIRRLPPCCGDDCGCCDGVGCCDPNCGASTQATPAAASQADSGVRVVAATLPVEAETAEASPAQPAAGAKPWYRRWLRLW